MSIFFEESGNSEGQTIVFLHGGGISGWMWQKQLEHFGDYHCIVPDLPEHGRSMDEGPLSIKDCSLRIARLIEERANGGKAVVVGHSLGAKVAVELLSARPDLVRCAVVASGLFRSMRLLKATHKPFIYKMTVWMIKSKSILSLLVKSFKFTDSYSRDHLIKDFQMLTAESLYRVYDQLYQNLDLPEGLDRVEVPTLVIAGDREIKAMKQSVADIAGALPFAAGAYMLKGDHTYPWSMYECFNEIIRMWIECGEIKHESVRKI